MRPRARPLSFADFELQSQGVALEATMQALADFLDAHEELVTLVHANLVRGLTRPRTGRDGLSAPQVLRAFVLQRVKACNLRELRERIADGYTLRIFTTFDAQPVPKHDAFNRAFHRLTPDTVRALNDAVVQAAVALRLEDGAKLRVDTTVVETDIHFPTDNTLLWDAVRVLTRLVQRLGEHVPSALSGFADRTRRARRRMQEISRLTPAQRPRRQTRKYRDLLGVTAGVVATARAAAYSGDPDRSVRRILITRSEDRDRSSERSDAPGFSLAVRPPLKRDASCGSDDRAVVRGGYYGSDPPPQTSILEPLRPGDARDRWPHPRFSAPDGFAAGGSGRSPSGAAGFGRCALARLSRSEGPCSSMT